jgi:uncharacterized protein (DUF4415 family)
MSEKKHSISPVWIDPDDAPDLSTPEWQARFAAAPTKRGRPKGARKRVVSLSLDLDVVDALRASGRGWQTRANEVLKNWIFAHPR